MMAMESAFQDMVFMVLLSPFVGHVQTCN
jgi:hypothetical protein